MPLWLVERVPTMDGPSHVYNGWLLARLWFADPPRLERVFAVRWEPIPNWTAEALLAAASPWLAPTAAEKVVLTLYVALLGWGLWALAGAVDRRRAWLACLALPWTYNLALDAGFYSFCFGLAGFGLAVAAGRRALEGRPGLLPAHAALAFTYLSHLVAHLAALGMLVMAWLWCGRRREVSFAARLLAPQAVLPLWFLWRQRGHGSEALTLDLGRLQGLLRLDHVFPWQSEAPLAAALLCLLFWLICAASLVRVLRRGPAAMCAEPTLAFWIGAVLLVLTMLAAPASALGGGAIPLRLGMLTLLCLLPALIPPAGAWPRRGLAGAAAIAALWGLAATSAAYRLRDRATAPAMAATRQIPRRSTYIAVALWPEPAPAHERYLRHVASYTAVERGLVDLANYEANSDFFPVRFRAEAKRPDTFALELFPATVDLTTIQPPIDAVVVHGRLPRGSPLERSLRAGYRRGNRRGPHRVWLRLTPPTPS